MGNRRRGNTKQQLQYLADNHTNINRLPEFDKEIDAVHAFPASDNAEFSMQPGTLYVFTDASEECNHTHREDRKADAVDVKPVRARWHYKAVAYNKHSGEWVEVFKKPNPRHLPLPKNGHGELRGILDALHYTMQNWQGIAGSAEERGLDIKNFCICNDHKSAMEIIRAYHHGNGEQKEFLRQRHVLGNGKKNAGSELKTEYSILFTLLDRLQERDISCDFKRCEHNKNFLKLIEANPDSRAFHARPWQYYVQEVHDVAKFGTCRR